MSNLTERGQLVSITSTIGNLLGIALAWRSDKGLLATVGYGFAGGLVGATAGALVAEATDLPEGLTKAPTLALPDGAPARPGDGTEADGFVSEDDRVAYGEEAIRAAQRTPKNTQIGIVRTMSAVSFTS